MRRDRSTGGFTLIELLVVISIIALLIAILVPSLSRARRQARAGVCLAGLHSLGQGITIYTSNYRDMLPPSRLPNIDDYNAYAVIPGGRKYRPTFLAMLGASVGVPPFDDPQRSRLDVDRHGEPGDRQNYASEVYVCPSVPQWTDERNGAYGWNYQFLGNSRLLEDGDIDSYKNWPVIYSRIRRPGSTVAVGDCMGTAASWSPRERKPYENNSRDADRFGNEGFNLDPPRVDPVRGEMANFDKSPQSRTALDPRHNGKGAVLWLDMHATLERPASLGYRVDNEGTFTFDGDNRLWSGTGQDVAWTVDGLAR